MKWVVRIFQGLLAIGFLLFGAMKLSGSPEQVLGFTSLGFPVWFMYVVGVGEVAGAIGLLAGYWKPSLAALAAAVLALIMVGAIVTVLVAGMGVVAALFPGAFLVLSLVVLCGRRSSN